MRMYELIWRLTLTNGKPDINDVIAWMYSNRIKPDEVADYIDDISEEHAEYITEFADNFSCDDVLSFLKAETDYEDIEVDNENV